MGLIIFSSEAFLQCPLTYDLSALGLFIDALQTDLVPRGGTDLGAALRMGQQKLQKAAKNTRHSTTQALVLLSNGEDFGQNNEKIWQKLKETGTHLFTVGVGSVAGSSIPTANGVRKDKKGNPIHTSLMRKPLQQIGHRYFEINQSSSQRPQLLAALKRLRGSRQSTQQANVQSNIYRYYLLAAAFFIYLGPASSEEIIPHMNVLICLLIMWGADPPVSKVNKLKKQAQTALSEARYEVAIEKYDFLIDSLGVDEPALKDQSLTRLPSYKR